MFKPLSELLSQHEIFRGMASPPGMPLPPPTELRVSSLPEVPQAPTMQEPSLLVRLHNLKPESPELQKRLRALLPKFGRLWAEAEELEQEIIAEHRHSLETQHAEIRKQGRKLAELVERRLLAAADAELALQNAAAHQQACLGDIRALADLERENRHVPRWATDQELAAWRERRKRAEGRIDPANARCAELLQERNQAADALNQARKELAELHVEDIRLRKALSGESFVDPELGLTAPGT